MYNYLDSVGYSSAIYFPILVLIGSFFLLNLFLAVIMETFIEMTETMKSIEASKKEAKLRKQRLRLKGQEQVDYNRHGDETVERMISVN